MMFRGPTALEADRPPFSWSGVPCPASGTTTKRSETGIIEPLYFVVLASSYRLIAVGFSSMFRR